MNWRLLIGLILALLATATDASAAETIKVTIKGMKFLPEAVTAHVGDTIEWTNEDFVGHTATARDKAFDLTIAPNKSASLMIQTAADAEYFCRFHPMMKGKLTVERGATSRSPRRGSGRRPARSRRASA